MAVGDPVAPTAVPTTTGEAIKSAQVAGSGPIPSPMSTPSPITKESLEVTKQPAVKKSANKPKLHVAEDSICESCE